MPDATRKIIHDLLAREMLSAREIARHEFASRAALAALEAVPSPDAKEEARLEEVDAYHQAQCMLERERVIEIRRQLKAYNINIPATLLEKEIEAEGDVELSAPPDNAADAKSDRAKYDGCADGCDCAGCEHAKFVAEPSDWSQDGACAEQSQDISPLAGDETPREAEEISAQSAPAESTIAAQIAALKAEIEARKAGQDPDAPKSSKPKSSKPKGNRFADVNIAPRPVPVLDSDADLLAALDAM